MLIPHGLSIGLALIITFKRFSMNITETDNPKQLGQVAGRRAATIVNEAIKEMGHANVILATGTSQFETLNQLLSESIDWRSEEHTSELQSRPHLVCRLLLEKKNNKQLLL